ncbi:hypothetical protein F1559_004073 [Cyanidiococcus yangmingshanensis]|uniref:RNA polymerase I-specific transcription initiation factor RRN3 n=1 Tax=Cyanidiococcus yangmingshanensis TaxID=2690220 RepID=A0A7J7IKQ2_9RHOD|nr:hypothetical protein F1559_004073 [Cyanidiococcus yangmingshanensis]
MFSSKIESSPVENSIGVETAILKENRHSLENRLLADAGLTTHGTSGGQRLPADDREALLTALRSSKESDLARFLEALTTVLPQITDGTWDNVIIAALAEGHRCPPDNKVAFQAFVVNLVLQNVQYLGPVISRLVQSFAQVHDDAMSTIHEPLRCIVTFMPRSEELLQFYIEKHFPHSSRSDQEFVMYVRMVLGSLNYARESIHIIISLLFRRLVALEVEYLTASEHHLEEQTAFGKDIPCPVSGESCEDSSVFDLECSERRELNAPLPGGALVPAEFAEQSAESLRRKLDMSLNHMFYFCKSACAIVPDSTLDALYTAFETHALPVARIRFVPFIMFVYLSESGPLYADTTLRRLLTVLVDSTRPKALRSRAVLYAGALAASNRAVTFDVALQWLRAISSWMHNQLGCECPSEQMGALSQKDFAEEPLYASLIAALYVIGARASHFLRSDLYREQVRSMRLARIMHWMPHLPAGMRLELIQAATIFPEFCFLTDRLGNYCEDAESLFVNDCIPFREYGLPESQQFVRAARLPDETWAMPDMEFRFDTFQGISRVSLYGSLSLGSTNGSSSNFGLTPPTST